MFLFIYSFSITGPIDRNGPKQGDMCIGCCCFISSPLEQR
uniref:Uncharacterized protein n=1 Tax=Anguilla anguilla TaxID=7936 RepID=A0A0E9R1N7_ANGAN